MANVATLGEQKLCGRKRHLLVDTAGNRLSVVVHRANSADRDGAYFVLEAVDTAFPGLQQIWADQAYTGDLVTDVQQQPGVT